MTSRTILFSAALLGTVLFPLSTFAQHHGNPSTGHPSRMGLGLTGRGHSAHRGHRGAFIYPYYWDDYGPEVNDQPEEPPAPPVNISVQQPQTPAPPPRPADSLLLEFHDGQWIRIPTGSQVPIGPQNAALQEPAPAPKNAVATAKHASPAPVTESAPVKLPPATLVFKDGHQEQVARYVVHGNFLYVSADYWTTGSWTRKIPISDLDVAASMKLNSERGDSFALPTRPNEVVVRF